MPGLQELTREDIGVRVGTLLRAVKKIEADASGSTTTFITDDLATLTTRDKVGKWLRFTSGNNNDGQIRQVITATVSTNRGHFHVLPCRHRRHRQRRHGRAVGAELRPRRHSHAD